MATLISLPVGPYLVASALTVAQAAAGTGLGVGRAGMDRGIAAVGADGLVDRLVNALVALTMSGILAALECAGNGLPGVVGRRSGGDRGYSDEKFHTDIPTCYGLYKGIRMKIALDHFLIRQSPSGKPTIPCCCSFAPLGHAVWWFWLSILQQSNQPLKLPHFPNQVVEVFPLIDPRL